LLDYFFFTTFFLADLVAVFLAVVVPAFLVLVAFAFLVNAPGTCS